MWCFNTCEKEWTEVPYLGLETPQARHNHAACLIGDIIYVFGGETFEGAALNDFYAFMIKGPQAIFHMS